jgi:hypothetical protein
MGQQTTANVSQTAAFAGMVVSTEPHTIRSYVSEEASAELPFGIMLKQGTADGQALQIDDAGDVAEFIGVLAHSHKYAKPTQVGDTGVKPDQSLNVLTKGVIWVEVEEAVTPLSAVRVRMVATGDEVAGAFRDTADDTTDCADVSLFCRYLTSAAANGLAQLEIDMVGRNSAVADS